MIINIIYFNTVTPTGRRLYCGNNHGELFLLNFMDGTVIDQVSVSVSGVGQ